MPKKPLPAVSSRFVIAAVVVVVALVAGVAAWVVVGRSDDPAAFRCTGCSRSARPARALVLFTPSAMEGYWEEVAAAAAAGRLDQARLDALARQHQLEIVGPWPAGG